MGSGLSRSAVEYVETSSVLAGSSKSVGPGPATSEHREAVRPTAHGPTGASFNTKINTFTGEMTDAMARRIQGLGDVPFDSEEEDEEEQPPAAPPTAAVQALERAAEEVQAHNATVGPRMTGGERKFVEALLQAHGTNYKAMAKDIKRNRSQETAGNLRRKVERYARTVGVSINALCSAVN